MSWAWSDGRSEQHSAFRSGAGPQWCTHPLWATPNHSLSEPSDWASGSGVLIGTQLPFVATATPAAVARDPADASVRA